MPSMPSLTDTEARTIIVQSTIDTVESVRESFPADGEELRAYLELALNNAVTLIQDELKGKIDVLANVLWSNETGGHAGRISELRKAAHAVIDTADVTLGKYRV